MNNLLGDTVAKKARESRRPERALIRRPRNGAKLRATPRPLGSTRAGRGGWRVVSGRIARATVSVGRVCIASVFAHSFEIIVARAPRSRLAVVVRVLNRLDLTRVSRRRLGSAELQFDLNGCRICFLLLRRCRRLTLYSVVSQPRREQRDRRSDWWFQVCYIFTEGNLCCARRRTRPRDVKVAAGAFASRPGRAAGFLCYTTSTDVGGEWSYIYVCLYAACRASHKRLKIQFFLRKYDRSRATKLFFSFIQFRSRSRFCEDQIRVKIIRAKIDQNLISALFCEKTIVIEKSDLTDHGV